MSRSRVAVLLGSTALVVASLTSACSSPEADSAPQPSPSSTGWTAPHPTFVPVEPPSGGASASASVPSDGRYSLVSDPSATPPLAEIQGLTEKDVQAAYAAAAKFALQGSYPLGLWHKEFASPDEATQYMWPAGLMTKSAANTWIPIAAGDTTAQGTVDDLIVSPPKVDGVWAFPAVAGHYVTNPSVSGGEIDTASGSRSVTVSLPVAAVAVYHTAAGEWFAIPVEKKYVLTMVNAGGSQGWVIDGWRGSTPAKFGTAEKLSEMPADRGVEVPVPGE